MQRQLSCRQNCRSVLKSSALEQPRKQNRNSYRYTSRISNQSQLNESTQLALTRHVNFFFTRRSPGKALFHHSSYRTTIHTQITKRASKSIGHDSAYLSKLRIQHLGTKTIFSIGLRTMLYQPWSWKSHTIALLAASYPTSKLSLRTMIMVSKLHRPIRRHEFAPYRRQKHHRPTAALRRTIADTVKRFASSSLRSERLSFLADGLQ